MTLPGGSSGSVGWCLGAGLLFLVPADLAAQHPDEVRTISGQVLQGKVGTIDEQGVLLDGDMKVPLEQVLEITFGNPVAAGSRPSSVVWLRSGQSIPGAVKGAAERTIEFTPLRSKPVPLPLRYVQAIRFAAKPHDDGGFERAVEEPSEKDLLFALVDGKVQRLSVELQSIDADQVHVEFRGAPQSLPFARVYGLVFGKSSGAPPDRPAGPRAVVQLTGGLRAEGKLLALDGKTVRLRLDEGFELEWPRAPVERIRGVTDALAFLSDLKPKLEQTPALDRVWPPLVDRGPGGGAIKLGGKEYARGLVLAPKTRLSYDLGGKYQWLAAVVGLEDRAGPQAHAILRVLADDKVIFDSGAVTPGMPPQELKLGIDGARTLTIEADFGKNLDLGDQCAFANARVWRER